MKAERLLREHRVDVRHRDRWQCLAIVRGDSGIEHTVRWTSSGWSCDCTASTYRRVCSHVDAVRHVIVTNRRKP